MNANKNLMLALILQCIMLVLPVPSKAQTKPVQISNDFSVNHNWNNTGNLISMPFTMKSGWEFSWGSNASFTAQLFRKDAQTNLYYPSKVLANHQQRERGSISIQESGVFFIVIQCDQEWHAKVNPLVD